MQSTIVKFCTTKSPFFLPFLQQQHESTYYIPDHRTSSQLWEVSRMQGPATSILLIITLNAHLLSLPEL